VTENIHVRETDRKSLDHITLKDGDEPAVTLRDRKRFFTEAIERARCADLSEADRHELVKHIRDRVSSIYYPPALYPDLPAGAFLSIEHEEPEPPPSPPSEQDIGPWWEDGR